MKDPEYQREDPNAQAESYYKAMLSRDYRFDGKFYVGVKTTGIYCRPICPARPKRENVEFFTDSYAAEKAGYRPCLRCHPEFSPQAVTWPGKSPIVQRALKLISQNALFEIDVERFAKQFQVSSRHLRRLFEKEVGLSPKQISDMHRLNFAHKLILETELEITQVAFSAGFGSLRRFNDAFKKRYKQPPRQMRRRKSSSEETSFTLHLAYRPPFDWENMLDYYRRHQIPFIEEVTQDSYQRLFKEGTSLGHIAVRNEPDTASLVLVITCPDPKVLFGVVTRVQKMFDLRADPMLIRNQFQAVPELASLWEEFPGLRIARGWDPFEIAIGTILGQVVSVKQASRLMGELVKQYGQKVAHPLTKDEAFLFPTPETLLQTALDEVKTTKARKDTIKRLCQALVNGEISFSEYQNPEEFKQKIETIKGIGPWSSEYMALRGLGDTNAFPKGDLVLKKALASYKDAFDRQQIAPWLGYLAVYLWKKFSNPG